MADLYVDTDNGNNANDGTSWALAKATLNAACVAIPSGIATSYVVRCRGSAADTVAVSLKSKSSTASNTITVLCDSAYRLEVDGSGGAIAFDSTEAYLRIDGLRMNAPADFSTYFLRVLAAETSDVRISNCVLNGNNPTGAVGMLRLSGQTRVWNTIVYRVGSQATAYAVSTNHISGSNLRMYNCTLIAPSNMGVSINQGTATFYNTYVASRVGYGFFTLATGTWSLFNCASSDTTTGSSNGCLSSVAYDAQVGAGHAGFLNVTGGSEDFRLQFGSPLVDTGTADPSEGLYATDVLGVPRPSGAGWDIGAHERQRYALILRG